MKKRNIIIIAVSVILVIATLLTVFLYILPKMKKEREQREFFEFLKQYYDDKSAAFALENETLDEVDAAFIGDSLTDGYDLKLYYPDMTVINRGISGDTTHGVLDRLNASVIDPKPRVIVMMIGTNNIYDMFTDYEDILVEIKDSLPDTYVVLVSIPPMSGDYAERNGQVAINNAKIESLAERYGYTYVDVFTPLLDFDTDELRTEFTTDGIHFTPLGYEVITSEVKPVLEALLADF